MVERSWIAVKAERVWQDGEGIVVMDLVSRSGDRLPPFSAGSHVDVETPGGLVRQYSLTGSPSDSRHYRIGVLREEASRGGSTAMHAVVPGQSLRISEPRNHFALDGDASRSILFAGGIGITPILCMAQRLCEIGADLELHYSGRTRARLAFLDLLRDAEFSDRAHIHLDDEAADQRLDVAAVLRGADRHTHIYVCGPPPYIDWVLAQARQAGLQEKQLHREFFTVDEAVEFAPGMAFEIRIASTGDTLHVPEDQAVVDVLLENGFDIPTSCEQGVCGTCVTRILEGTPDHRDFYMTAEEHSLNDQFTPCCSRSKTPVLVLDL